MRFFSDFCQQNILKKVDLPLCIKTGRSKGCAFLNVPGYTCSESVKFNEVKFKSNPFVSEEAKTKHTPDKQMSPHHQFTDYYFNITHQHEQQQEHPHHQQQQQQKQRQG